MIAYYSFCDGFQIKKERAKVVDFLIFRGIV